MYIVRRVQSNHASASLFRRVAADRMCVTDEIGGGSKNVAAYSCTSTRYFVTLISTRRFLARPASVVFGITGLVSAAPIAWAPESPPSAKACTALAARASDNSLFEGNFFFSAPWTGRLSVWPST